MPAIRELLRRPSCAFLAGLALLLAAAPVALAAYPPGAFPGPGPGGAFPTVVASQVICASGATVHASRGALSLTLEVPASAFGDCTQVTIYGGTEAVLAAALPKGSILVDAFAVSWDPAGEARQPLIVTVAGPAIGEGVSVFETRASGLTQVVGAPVRPDAVSISLTTAGGLVLASPAPKEGVAGMTGTPRPSTAPATSPAQQDTGSPGVGLTVVLVLLVIAVSTVVIAARLRYRRASSRR